MPRPDALQTFFGATKVQVFSEDLSTALLWAYDLPAVSGDMADRNNMYLEDTATRALVPITVSQQDPLALFDFLNANVWGLSADAHHVAFVTNTRLLPAAVVGAPNLYQWDDGVLTLAGHLPDGTLSPSGATVSPANYRGAMSADGTRLAFTSSAGSDPQLYLRIDGGRSVWVSQPEGSDQATPVSVALQGMTRDGHNVFFVTDSALLDSDTNSGPDVYRYTDSAEPDVDRNLTMISQNGDTPNSTGGAVVGFSEDGDRIYYHTANDRLAVWDHGITHILRAAVTRSATGRLRLTVTASDPGFGRVTPDGMYMAFLANDAPDNVHGPTGEITNGHYELYVYSLSDGTLKCASCPAAGATSDAAVTPDVTLGNPTLDNVTIRPRFLDDSGRVYFSTRESLVTQDRNGVSDTYAYDGATGELSLISTGRGRDPTEFVDASTSGDDVFVLTRQPLGASDHDDLVDLYDVRVGPAPPESQIQQPLPCDGEGCQASPSTAPAEDALGSLLLDDGDPGPPGPKALVAQRKATLHGASGSLSIRLLTPGTLEWRGRGLRSGSARRGRAGTVRLSVHLTRSGKARLRNRGSYRTTLRLKLVQADGAEVTSAVRVTFRATATKGR
jgi:hypothetical protein